MHKPNQLHWPLITGLGALALLQPIPAFHLPLQPDAQVEVDLNRLLQALYDRAGYDLRIDYRGEAEPALQGNDAAWGDYLSRTSRIQEQA